MYEQVKAQTFFSFIQSLLLYKVKSSGRVTSMRKVALKFDSKKVDKLVCYFECIVKGQYVLFVITISYTNTAKHVQRHVLKLGGKY